MSGKKHLDRVLRGRLQGSAEETLKALLDAAADGLCDARRYERSEVHRDTRAGCYERKLQTQGWRGKAADTEVSPADFRDGDHRALSAAREFGRGGLIEMYLANLFQRSHRPLVSQHLQPRALTKVREIATMRRDSRPNDIRWAQLEHRFIRTCCWE